MLWRDSHTSFWLCLFLGCLMYMLLNHMFVANARLLLLSMFACNCCVFLLILGEWWSYFVHLYPNTKILRVPCVVLKVPMCGFGNWWQSQQEGLYNKFLNKHAIYLRINCILGMVDYHQDTTQAFDDSTPIVYRANSPIIYEFVNELWMSLRILVDIN